MLVLDHIDNLPEMNEQPQKYWRETVSQVMETNIIIESYKFEIIHNEAVFLGNNLKASAIQGQQQMVIIFLIPTMQTNIPQ